MPRPLLSNLINPPPSYPHIPDGGLYVAPGSNSTWNGGGKLGFVVALNPAGGIVFRFCKYFPDAWCISCLTEQRVRYGFITATGNHGNSSSYGNAHIRPNCTYIRVHPTGCCQVVCDNRAVVSLYVVRLICSAGCPKKTVPVESLRTDGTHPSVAVCGEQSIEGNLET